jgi:membrane protease subunit HflC
MTYRAPLSLLLAILAWALVVESVFVVPQGSTGVVTRFEAPTTLNLKPGAHLKLPFLDKARDLDAGGITLDGDSLNGGSLKFDTAGGEAVTAGYFALWRISDTAAFCAAEACDESAAAHDLNSLVLGGLRLIFAGKSQAAAISGQADLTQGLAEKLNPAAWHLGVQLVEVHLSALSLPPARLEDIYAHMRSAEETHAAQVAADGAALAAKKRADTDAERDRILAGADAAAARLRAGGEADAAAIDAQASRPAPAFFDFYQGLAAYRRSLAGKTVLVLGPDSPFLKYLKPPAH